MQAEKIVAALLYAFVFLGPLSILFSGRDENRLRLGWTGGAVLGWVAFLVFSGLLIAMRMGTGPEKIAVTILFMWVFFLWPVYLPKWVAATKVGISEGSRSVPIAIATLLAQIVPVTVAFWLLQHGVGPWLNEEAYRFFTDIPDGYPKP